MGDHFVTTGSCIVSYMFLAFQTPCLELSTHRGSYRLCTEMRETKKTWPYFEGLDVLSSVISLKIAPLWDALTFYSLLTRNCIIIASYNVCLNTGTWMT